MGMGSMEWDAKHATCYTKWHTSDQDNVDLQLSPSPTTLTHVVRPRRRRTFTSRDYWPASYRGMMVKALWVFCVFCLGLILGYSTRRQIQLRRGSFTGEPGSCEDLPPQLSLYPREGLIRKLVKSVSRDNIHSWLWTMTREFHVGGSDKGATLASKIRAAWQTQELQGLRIEEFRPLLSYPDMERANEVRLTRGSRVLFQLTTTTRDNQLETQPYVAYSSPGKVRGKPVYVHFGQPEDFDMLKSRGVTLNGTIAIMRYGKGELLAKIKRAEDNGVKGVLIYGDPLDTEWESVDPLESGSPPVPWDAVERASLKSFPGDPATPFLPASSDMHRLPRADVQLPAIPVQPISAGDAQHFLRDMGGPVAPVQWQGRLNITFAFGPGYKDAAEVEIQLSSFNLFREMAVHNVIGLIPGTYEPGRYLIIGCHHDAWTHGAADPGTGMAVLMEVARMFSDLVRIEGWRPKRTLVFAAWDAAEFGQVGSTEFVQKYGQELGQRIIAYISLDRAITGNRTLQVMGSPLLRQVLSEAAEQVPEVGSPEAESRDDDNGADGRRVAGEKKTEKDGTSDAGQGRLYSRPASSPMQSNPPSLYASWARRGTLRPSNIRNPRPEMSPPAGGCADLLPFAQLLGTSTVHVQLVARDGRYDYPAARTAYDDLDYLIGYADPGQHAAAALAQLVAVFSLALIDSLRLPIKVTDYAEQISADFAPFQRRYGEFFRSYHLRMDVLAAAVRAFTIACRDFQEEYEDIVKDQQTLAPTTVAEYNERVMQLERSFLLPAGYPRHPHQRHLVYGPDNEDDSRGALFPHLVVAIRQARKRPTSPALSYVRENLSLVLHALRSASGVLDRSLLRVPEERRQS
ncbi:N-acetylated-alpha-linked acidic dipeptidase-like protein isoform X2 [Varroa destructor]|uniref:Uncharacterized protein n=1 Tax=Varroa destructor TaxID=109461 RepID=A0A7M7KA25_VARDE|nr:N-acetylated-alpha-linked acidic dipeptidase-like protein isoform X2 [Varroa destructor]